MIAVLVAHSVDVTTCILLSSSRAAHILLSSADYRGYGSKRHQALHTEENLSLLPLELLHKHPKGATSLPFPWRELAQGVYKLRGSKSEFAFNLGPLDGC